MQATPSREHLGGVARQRRAEGEYRRLDLGQRRVIAAEFGAARYLQVHVQIAAAVGAQSAASISCCQRSGVCGLRMRSSRRLRVRRARFAARRAALPAPRRDHLVDAVTEQEAAIQRRDARLAQRQQLPFRWQIGSGSATDASALSAGLEPQQHGVAQAAPDARPRATSPTGTAAPWSPACRRRSPAARPPACACSSGAISGCRTLALVSMLPAWPRGTDDVDVGAPARPRSTLRRP